MAFDPVIGEYYLSAEQFKARARVFGVAPLALAKSSQDDLVTALALASRAIDSYLGRDFSADAVTEQHEWNVVTRRIKVNRPPISQIISFQIRTSPNSVAVIRPEECYVNNQENYIEVAALAITTGVLDTVLALGLITPIAEVTYTSYDRLPSALVAATGFAAASILNNSMTNTMIAPGIKSIETGDQVITAKGAVDFDPNFVLPPQAVSLLKNLNRVACA